MFGSFIQWKPAALLLTLLTNFFPSIYCNCRLSKQVDLTQHALELLQQRFEGSELHQLTTAITTCETELKEAEDTATAAKQRKQDLIAEAQTLQYEMANFGKEKDKHVKAAKDKIKAAKQRVEACKKALKTAEAALQVALAECESAATERKSLAVQLQSAQEAAAKLQAQVNHLASVVAETKGTYDEAVSRLEELRARLKECDAEISAAVKAKSALEKRKTDIVVEKKKSSNK